MTQDIGLDPYLDYSKITDEMVTDMCGAIREKCEAETEMVTQPSRQATERLLKAVDNITETAQAIEAAIFTVPAIIHNPGEPHEEELNGVTVMIQRCTRCQSPLNGWQEGLLAFDADGNPCPLALEDMQWADIGKPTAKVNHGPGGGLIYAIKDREPEAHERECVQMPELDI